MAALSVVDLAVWDLLGKIRGEPVYKMIGGRTKKDIPLYLTGPRPAVAEGLGFWGSKVPLPHGPPDGLEGIRKNVAYLKQCKDAVGPDYPVMVDCWMSLDVPYTISLIKVRIPPSSRIKADHSGVREGRCGHSLVGGGAAPGRL
jgi:L-rhamnonate dehydratase